MVPETLYITVQVIDRYLELKQVRRSRLQLVGVAALLVSSIIVYSALPSINHIV
jgi:hypothetical protein